MSGQPRHEQLLSAGWQYDADQDRYTAPDAPADGTATLYTRDAAWQVFMLSRQGRPRRDRPDPREQEPQ